LNRKNKIGKKYYIQKEKKNIIIKNRKIKMGRNKIN
jgi:hypothetical protein